MRFRVQKYGGSSVAEAANWTHIAANARRAADEAGGVIVVVSALRGITDLLEAQLDPETASEPAAVAAEIARRHQALLAGLGLDANALAAEVAELGERLESAARSPGEPAVQAALLAMGERLSSRLGVLALKKSGLDACWLDSREILISRTDQRRGRRARFLSAECEVAPDAELAARLARRARVHVAPGYMARNPDGQTVVLGRGGSDTSAALIAVAVRADQVEIYSDVPGLFSADPRRIPAARLLKVVGYREAQELAAMGAKALHPRALIPLRQHAIPLKLFQTGRPEIPGTRISVEAREHGAQVKAIVQRRGITLIALEGIDMWQQVGFLADVFGVFRDHGLSVDLVSTSESNVTLTLDPTANPVDHQALEALAADLGELCKVEVLTDCATVSLVGVGIRTILHRLGPALEVFEQRRIFQVSQAANDLNLTFVVEARHADRLVQQLHQQIIPGGTGGESVFGPTWEQLFRPDRAAQATPPWWQACRERLLELMAGRDAAYVYDLATIAGAAGRLTALEAVDRVLYSMKANPHPAILKTVTDAGLGIECVSLAEARSALRSCDRLTPADLLFTPNFAPREEYRQALALGVPVTIDNLYILEHWGADFAGREVFLRVDPGSGLGHHKMVRTAGVHAKFGVPMAEIERAASLCAAHDIRITGLHAHTGSGIMHPDNWHRSLEVLGEVAREIDSVETINLGGGLGVPERADELPLDLAALASGIGRLKADLPRPVAVWLEPGRFLAAPAGVLLAKVTQTKGKGEVRYLGVATGMNSLIRPALYGAWHEIVNLTRLDVAGDHVYNVVGPICETGDILGLDRLLPESREGDVILIANAGAYGAAMASRYNLREPAEELVLESTAMP